MSTILQLVEKGEDLDVIREMFREYSAWLEDDFCTKNMDQELASLPGAYAPPQGRLYLASTAATRNLGCIALRALNDTTGELKRLYVRPAGRRIGLGRKLAETVIIQAKLIGYRSLRLDTLPVMHDAIRLYESLGFRRIEPPDSSPNIGEYYYWKDL